MASSSSKFKGKRKMSHLDKVASTPFQSLDIFPNLKILGDFKDEKPAIFTEVSLPPERTTTVNMKEFTFLEFLDKIPVEDIDWQRDANGQVLHFGIMFGKIFRDMAEIIFSYNKKNHFSGDVIGRMRILSDLHVHHPFPEVKQPKHSREGRKTDILHFRWLVARVIKKCFQEDYERILSKSFTLGFSETFLHPEGQKHYYMLQYNHPIFYNDEEKYKMVHALKDWQKQNPNAFLRLLGVEKTEYGFDTWWSRLSDETTETMLGGVYFHIENNMSYVGRPNDLPSFLRNCHEHFEMGMQNKKTRLEILNREIGTRNKRAREQNESLWRRTRHLGEAARAREMERREIKMEVLHKMDPPSLHDELEPKITKKFPGVYSCLLDLCIRQFHDSWKKLFRCPISELLLERAPFASEPMYRVYDFGN